MPNLYRKRLDRRRHRIAVRPPHRPDPAPQGEIVRPFAAQLAAVDTASPVRVVGRVEGMSGLTIEAAGLSLPVGSMCRLINSASQSSLAEVIGFRGERTILMPLTDN